MVRSRCYILRGVHRKKRGLCNMHTLIRVVDWGDLPPTGVAQSSLYICELNQRRLPSGSNYHP